jgi:hypothetical protein
LGGRILGAAKEEHAPRATNGLAARATCIAFFFVKTRSAMASCFAFSVKVRVRDRGSDNVRDSGRVRVRVRVRVSGRVAMGVGCRHTKRAPCVRGSAVTVHDAFILQQPLGEGFFVFFLQRQRQG